MSPEETEALKTKIMNGINDMPKLVDYFKLMVYDSCIIPVYQIKNSFNTFMPEATKNDPGSQKSLNQSTEDWEKLNQELGKKLSEFIITPEEIDNYKKYCLEKFDTKMDTAELIIFQKLIQGLEIIISSSASALAVNKFAILTLSQCADVKNQNS